VIKSQDSDPGEAIAPLEYVMALATEGLVAALSKQVAVLRTRYKLSVDAQLGEEPTLSLEGKQALYRIALGALHNIVKHACASTVTLRLARQDGELILEETPYFPLSSSSPVPPKGEQEHAQ
jgi:hypothetical protein